MILIITCNFSVYFCVHAFRRRNYDALMIYSVYDNVMSNVDHVRDWLDALKAGSDRLEKKKKGILPIVDNVLSALNLDDSKEADQHESIIFPLILMDMTYYFSSESMMKRSNRNFHLGGPARSFFVPKNAENKSWWMPSLTCYFSAQKNGKFCATILWYDC